MLPLCLTALLFAGPLCMLALDWRAGVSPLSRSAQGPAALRNYLVAPLTEEFMFRCGRGLYSFGRVAWQDGHRKWVRG